MCVLPAGESYVNLRFSQSFLSDFDRISRDGRLRLPWDGHPASGYCQTARLATDPVVRTCRRNAAAPPQSVRRPVHSADLTTRTREKPSGFAVAGDHDIGAGRQIIGSNHDVNRTGRQSGARRLSLACGNRVTAMGIGAIGILAVIARFQRQEKEQTPAREVGEDAQQGHQPQQEGGHEAAHRQ